MVIRRSDGSYVFHFVNVVDDLEMQITHVIRGEDHLMNTPKHLQLIEALGGTAPAYAHIPLILNPNGSKMSKRDEGAAVADYPRRGYVPAAVVNFLALLGWSPKSEEEIFSLEELVARFSLEAVNRAPARFDGEKCAWVNQQHLLRMGLDEFVDVAMPMVKAAGLPVEKDFARAMALVKDKVRLLDELPEAAGFLLTEDFSCDPAAEAKARGQAMVAEAIPALALAFRNVETWSGDAAKTALAEVAAALGVKPGALMFPLRVALSGRSGGPDIAAIMEYLGQEACALRLENFAHGSR
jgi:glutamyl-tRNA synthetase